MADLVVNNVTKEYPTRGEPLVILRGVSLGLNVGENLAILGPSGSGKSTLLNILGTLDSPTAGSVQLRNENPFSFDERGLSQFRNRHIGFVFQEHHLLPQLSVLENVLLPTIAEGQSTEVQIQRARMLLDRVGLSQRLEHRPAELSGGERQRAAVARALINQPLLLLADEPTGNLDRSNAMSVGKLLLDLQQHEKMILVVVTHSTELASLFQRRLELDNGKLVNEG